MFWADRRAEEIKEVFEKQIADGAEIVIRDEKTASGRIHVGSMRGVSIHGILSEILKFQNVPNTFLYEINDFDAFDTVPAYLDSSYKEHLGKPLFAIPAPDLPAGKAGGDGSYAEYFGSEFMWVIEETGFHPTFYYSSDQYKKGAYNDVIRIAIERADDIRRIYREVSGGERGGEWLPVMPICEKCGKVATTRAVSFDGEKVHYICDQEGSGAKGCGYKGDVSPFDGRAKLHFKAEWAAKFKIFEVLIEGEGKDLSTKGGARDVANHIAREVFDYEPPYDIPYEFFLVGGKKMSASKGTGSSAREIADLMPPHIFRLALLGKDPKQAFNFDPEGDTLPVLFDRYDTIAQKYYSDTGDDDARLFLLVHARERRERLVRRFLPRFSQVAFIVQMPHMNLEDEVGKMKGEALTDLDKEELEMRAKYARKWLEQYAPEEFRFELQEKVPDAAKKFTSEQKKALQEVIAYVKKEKKLDGQELHTKLHEIRKSSDLEPNAFFSALNLSFLGKKYGPKAGWFLSVLEKDFLERRLEEVSR